MVSQLSRKGGAYPSMCFPVVCRSYPSSLQRACLGPMPVVCFISNPMAMFSQHCVLLSRLPIIFFWSLLLPLSFFPLSSICLRLFLFFPLILLFVCSSCHFLLLAPLVSLFVHCLVVAFPVCFCSCKHLACCSGTSDFARGMRVGFWPKTPWQRLRFQSGNHESDATLGGGSSLPICGQWVGALPQ